MTGESEQISFSEASVNDNLGQWAIGNGGLNKCTPKSPNPGWPSAASVCRGSAESSSFWPTSIGGDSPNESLDATHRA